MTQIYIEEEGGLHLLPRLQCAILKKMKMGNEHRIQRQGHFERRGDTE